MSNGRGRRRRRSRAQRGGRRRKREKVSWIHEIKAQRKPNKLAKRNGRHSNEQGNKRQINANSLLTFKKTASANLRNKSEWTWVSIKLISMWGERSPKAFRCADADNVDFGLNEHACGFTLSLSFSLEVAHVVYIVHFASPRFYWPICKVVAL